jgi:small subunit ribosomal protein S19
MARSVWKGPFVEESLIKKVEKIKNDPNKKPIKTWSRKSTIIPDFVGFSFLIYLLFLLNFLQQKVPSKLILP